MPLYPHQVTGAQWLKEQRRRCVGLFDDPGLGKTITALQAAKELGVRTVLCIVPAVVLYNWKREAERWFEPDEDRVVVLDGDLRENRFALDAMQAYVRVAIVSRDRFWRSGIRDLLLSRRHDLCIVDESHGFKTPTAIRSEALFGFGEESILKTAERQWMLTGTPMPNHAGELWTFLQHAAPDRIAKRGTKATPVNYASFVNRFCRTHPGIVSKILGSKNLAELRKRCEGLWLRRLKKDHLDLPPVRSEEITVRASKREAFEIERLEDELTWDDVLDAVGGDPLAALRSIRKEEINMWRRLCGQAKVDPVAELLSEELRAGLPKIVVMAHHTSVVRSLETRLASFKHVGANAVTTITGATTARERQARVDRFQDPNSGLRVLVCNIVAGGVGQTLTAADELLFVELSYTPGENVQAANRILRIGQTSDRVRIRYVSLDGSIDARLVSILQRKAVDIYNMLDKGPKQL